MKKQILLIDDDMDELLFLCDGFTRAGIDHSCTWAKDVEHAIAILQHFQPEVIFIDMNMPKINGMSGIGMIRERFPAHTFPIILYSTSIPPSVCDDAIAKGANACLVKPDCPKKLAHAISDLLSSMLSTPSTE